MKGAGPTNLYGLTEVAGAKANVVFVNPNGITCEGCGFSNAPRVTLAAANARFNKARVFDGFTSSGGTVSIKGTGLDASRSDYFDIVASKAVIDGGIVAQDIVVSTGNHTFNYANRSVTAAPFGVALVSGNTLDSTALGGMYAARIRLVATGTAAGINLGGVVRAGKSADIKADGSVTVSKVAADSSVSIGSKNAQLTLNDDIYSGNTVTLAAQGIQQNVGLIEAGGAASLVSSSAIYLNGGGVLADANTSIVSKNPYTLSLKAEDELLVKGAIKSLNNMTISAGSFNSTETGSVETNGRIEIKVNKAGLSLINGSIKGNEINILGEYGIKSSFDIYGDFSSANSTKPRAKGIYIDVAGDVNLHNNVTTEGFVALSAKTMNVFGTVDSSRVSLLFGKLVNLNQNSVLKSKQIGVMASEYITVFGGATIDATEALALHAFELVKISRSASISEPPSSKIISSRTYAHKWID